MDDSATSGAMTEIALALAMAFFCILVLALLSMGTPRAGAPDELQPLASTDAVSLESPGRTTKPRPVGPDERLVLLVDGRYVDRNGLPVDPADLGDDAPVVLAVDPSLPLDQVLAARAAFTGDRVSVTTLDSAWSDHLAKGGMK